jgi:hypothetical protein
MPANILVLDPLTLLGRELLTCSDRLGAMAASFDYLHTDLDDEHQIAEIGSGPALVPPLDSADQLAECDVVVVASDGVASRHDHMLEALDLRPDLALLDLSRLECLDPLVEPSTGHRTVDSRRIRIAHPAAAASVPIIEALGFLGRCRGSMAAFDPVSAFGREGIDLLVQQAALRLQGGTVEDRIHGHILAFNTVAVDPSSLQAEIAVLMPDVPMAATRCLTGAFHGHLVSLALSFERAVEANEVKETLEQVENLEVVPPPLGLDGVPDSDSISVAPPSLSAEGSQLALVLMVDGLRIGGALTACDILDSMF